MKKDFLISSGPFGLGNRVTSICCGYAIAKLNNLNPVFNWEKTNHCQAGFLDLFTEIEGYKQTNGHGKIGEGKFVCNNFIDGVGRKNALSFLKNGFDDDFLFLFKEAAKKIKLKEELSCLVPKNNNYSSLHIRINDRPPTKRDFELINKIKIYNVFLCCDNDSVIDMIDRAYIDYWTFAKNRSKYDLGNRDLCSVKEAAIEMMILTKSKTIYALGKHSTFRNLASIGYDVPVLTIDSGI